MIRESTQPGSEFGDADAGPTSFTFVRGGPFILIEADMGNLGSPVQMQNQIDLVRDVSERLDAVELGYMLTGSMAMNFYSLPCLPRNLDFVIALRPADAEAMVRLFKPDYDITREAVDSAIAQQAFFNLVHRNSGIKVSGIVCQQIKYRLTEFNRRQRVKFENLKTWIVSKEDLIISKLHWARKSHSERHLRDVTNLAATGCDADYVERWTQALGIFTLWQDCSPF
jgi:hypothetical protein